MEIYSEGAPQLCGGAGEENQRGNANQGTEMGASLLCWENSVHGVGRGWAVGRVSVLVPEAASSPWVEILKIFHSCFENSCINARH